MTSSDYLAHHGIRGQLWGVRRFQNEDGTLTSAGKRRERDRPVGREKHVTGSGSVNKKPSYGLRPVGREKHVTEHGTVTINKPSGSGGGGIVDEDQLNNSSVAIPTTISEHPELVDYLHKVPKPNLVLSDVPPIEHGKKILAQINSFIGSIKLDDIFGAKTQQNRPVGRKKHVTGSGSVSINKDKDRKRPVGREKHVTGSGFVSVNRKKR